MTSINSTNPIRNLFSHLSNWTRIKYFSYFNLKFKYFQYSGIQEKDKRQPIKELIGGQRKSTPKVSGDINSSEQKWKCKDIFEVKGEWFEVNSCMLYRTWYYLTACLINHAVFKLWYSKKIGTKTKQPPFGKKCPYFKLKQISAHICTKTLGEAVKEIEVIWRRHLKAATPSNYPYRRRKIFQIHIYDGVFTNKHPPHKTRWQHLIKNW